MTVTLFLATHSKQLPWERHVCVDIEAAHDLLEKARARTTHWAVCPTEKSDGGCTPPIAATIHSID